MTDDSTLSLPDTVPRLDLGRWSDALQRYIDMPASALWPMACLAYQLDSTIDKDARPPELEAWLRRVQGTVAEIVGADDWDDAVRALRIPSRIRGSLAAWLESDAAPSGLRDSLRGALEE